MSLKQETQEICNQYQIQPLRRRGQNFLINQDAINKLLDAANLEKSDCVIEIGAGLGILTQEISEKVKKVLAVEIDKKLIEVLKEKLKDYKNVEILQEDILQIPNSRFQILDSYKVVANLPFNITSAVLRKFLENPDAARGRDSDQERRRKPKSITLILQKEVGERILARPPEMNLLAISIQFYSQPKRIFKISKENFWPKPKVDSIILQIIPNYESNRTNVDEDVFFKIVRAGFSSPRKYLLNNLVKSAMVNKEEGENILSQTNLSLKSRAQELSIENWINLVNKIKK
ncbi:MAG: 16S rRNA (adenine(1518)-N(6)/adenine(1519)-N(6))-dimethyltransferase RsmA [Patescibacteria group bacterium]|nr:16S rRNA (adenine(1518)-N(6)/adenine(1519)-N(6))-dimethyltransferase RsmA [Patescibacteria group bacterium]MDD5164337.1 16S rRNA (adenine(1518)-N(6)/adenine(1519)-N(6))-dimethyltransferase RsmA [Patescibacteria group bacterium]MDD5534295.1 16S rRNA (adenine(1518)-N(6)/adenine(1519)-N(6))-dimethyltransferase RsmA [Patescibacteria group bacterium]